MSGTVAAILAACLIVPAAWGWLVAVAFRGLGLARFFPLRDLPPSARREPWDFQI